MEEVAAISRLILDAATEIFKNRAFDDVSIDAIAERAGVERNTVYKRFPDKRSVLQAVLVQQVSGWAGEAGLAAPTGDLTARLNAHATRLLQRAMSPDVRVWSHLAEIAWPGLDELGHRREVLGYNRMVDILSREIAGAKGAEAGGSADPDFVATALMAILTGWTETVGHRGETPAAEIRTFARSAVDLVMLGHIAR